MYLFATRSLVYTLRLVPPTEKIVLLILFPRRRKKLFDLKIGVTVLMYGGNLISERCFFGFSGIVVSYYKFHSAYFY